MDNKVIFLRHGGNIISTSQSRLLKVKTSRSDTDTSLPNPKTDHIQKVPLSGGNKISQISNRNTESDMDSDEEVESEERPPDIHEIPLNTEEPEKIIQAENHAQNKPEKRILPKKGDMIEYKNKDEEVWYKAKILERTSKGNVSKNVHFNIDREEGGKAGIILENFDWRILINTASRQYSPGPSVHTEILYDGEQINKAQLHEQENENYVVFIPRKDWEKPFVLEAKEKELKNFESYGAYETVPDQGQARLTSGWVITEKLYGDIVGCKARLVVHGNQETYNFQKDSPTVTKQTLRIVFSLAAQYGWEVITSDVTSAFLQSDKLDREVYVQPPSDVRKPGTIWRLNKPMYGLDDAGLKWYQTVDNKLRGLGCRRLHTDLAVFYYLKGGRLRGIAAWHVDDMINTGDETFYADIVKPLMDEFTFGSTSEGTYRCLGWNIKHAEGSILVSQSDYIQCKIDYLQLEKQEERMTRFYRMKKRMKLEQV